MKRLILTLLISTIFQQFYSQGITVTVGTVSSQDTLVQVSVPFYVSGLDATTGGTAVVAMEYYIDFNNQDVQYVNITNFYSGLPVSEWIYGVNGSRFGCNWVDPQFIPTNIPDNTKLFDLVFFYKRPVTTTLNLSETDCVLVNGAFQQIPNSQITFNDGQINYSGFTFPPNGLTEISPTSFISFPDSIVRIPVYSSGFGTENSSLYQMKLSFQLDSGILGYEGIIEFSSVLPENEWSIEYDPETAQINCTWNETNSVNRQIPDQTKLFDIVLKGQEPGTSAIEFLAEECYFAHFHIGQSYSLVSDFIESFVQIIEIPNPPPGNLSMVPDLFITYPDSLISIPFQISGFENENSALSTFNLSIIFDTTYLQFLEAVNFNELLPENEWIIDFIPEQQTLNLTWVNSINENQQIPDQTILFELKFKPLIIGGTSVSFNPELCYFKHNFYSYQINLSASFNNAVIQIFDNTIPLPGQVNITPSLFTSYPDSVINVPVYLSGFNTSQTTLSQIKLVLTFNDTLISFQNLSGYSNIMPEDQWTVTFDPLSNQLICEWAEPDTLNIAIPNSTKIFDISFIAEQTGTTEIVFDSAQCRYFHTFLGNNFERYAYHSNAIVNIIDIPLPPPGLVYFEPDNFSTFPDSTLHIPVNLSGFSDSYSSLAGMQLNMDISENYLGFISASNFNPLLPSTQWIIQYNQADGTIVFNWAEPFTNNIIIPNETHLFDLDIKAINTGVGTIEFDSSSCMFIHMINSTQQLITANFENATINIENLPIPPPGELFFQSEQYNVNTGNTFNVPVLISGFGNPNSSLTELEITIQFDGDIIDPLSVINFSSLMPQEQWTITTFIPNEIKCIWENPSGQNLQIPDSLILFGIEFFAETNGISEINFDSAQCHFYHVQGTANMELSAFFGTTTITVLSPVIPEYPEVKIIPEYIQQISGVMINVPVVLFGFNTDSTTLAAIEFYIDFDPFAIQYQGVANFNPFFPENQWIYNSNTGRFLCNWVEPTLQNLSVSDSLTIFEIQFLCLSNQTDLVFDSAAGVFAHMSGSSPVNIPVVYQNGHVTILPDQIDEKSDISKNIYSVQNQIIIHDLSGNIRLFNSTGQLIGEYFANHNDDLEIQIPQNGIYIVEAITSVNTRLIRKILIMK